MLPCCLVPLALASCRSCRMAVPQDPPSLFERLMTRNREACEAGYYSTAYHLLAAARHAAAVQHVGRNNEKLSYSAACKFFGV